MTDDSLEALRGEFPRYRFSEETTGDGVRFHAQAADLSTRPYAVITADLAELRAALAEHQVRAR